MLASKAVCWVALRTSPVVLRKTTASYWARLAVVNAVASSVAVTVKLLAAPRSRIAWMPTAIESCRKPAVLQKTRTSYGVSAALAGGRAARRSGEASDAGGAESRVLHEACPGRRLASVSWQAPASGWRRRCRSRGESGCRRRSCCRRRRDTCRIRVDSRSCWRRAPSSGRRCRCRSTAGPGCRRPCRRRRRPGTCPARARSGRCGSRSARRCRCRCTAGSACRRR